MTTQDSPYVFRASEAELVTESAFAEVSYTSHAHPLPNTSSAATVKIRRKASEPPNEATSAALSRSDCGSPPPSGGSVPTAVLVVLDVFRGRAERRRRGVAGVQQAPEPPGQYFAFERVTIELFAR